MNIISLLLFYFLQLSIPASDALDTTVVWTEQSPMPASEVIYFNPDRKLKWSDFRGTPVEGRAAAITVSGFGYRARVTTGDLENKLVIQVYCYFNKNKSWVKPGRTTDYILEHEQKHFDIAYIAARIFESKLAEANFTISNYNDLLQKIYDDSSLIMNKMQEDYDRQTRNGQEKEKQMEWNSMVSESLASIHP